MNTRKAYTNVLKVIFLVILFLSAMSLACDDGPSCGNLPGDTPCPQPANIIMGDKNIVEEAVDNLVCGDGSCDNTLSGGN